MIEEVKEGEVEPDDFDDEAEIMKLIKEEDINAVPENTDVSEIDKLTGIPKPKGKLDYVKFFRLTFVLYTNAGSVLNDPHF